MITPEELTQRLAWAEHIEESIEDFQFVVSSLLLEDPPLPLNADTTLPIRSLYQTCKQFTAFCEERFYL